MECYRLCIYVNFGSGLYMERIERRRNDFKSTGEGTTPKKNKNTAGLKCVRVVRCCGYTPPVK